MHEAATSLSTGAQAVRVAGNKSEASGEAFNLIDETFMSSNHVAIYPFSRKMTRQEHLSKFDKN